MIVTLVGCGQGFSELETSTDIDQQTSTADLSTLGTVSTIFIGTKDDADCSILQVKEGESTKTIMIDTGEEQDAEHILEVLKENEIEELELLIITHPDKDHIGGLEDIVSSISIKEVVIPYYKEPNEKYMRLLKRVTPIKNKVTVLTENETRTYGGLSLFLYAPKETYYKKDNNYSIATLVQYGEVRMFFAGDAMKDRTRELLKENLPQVDLYKIAYHGREYKDFDQLFWELNPTYTVVTAKEAEEEVYEVLEESGTQIFYTRNQDLYFETDGINLNIL